MQSILEEKMILLTDKNENKNINDNRNENENDNENKNENENENEYDNEYENKYDNEYGNENIELESYYKNVENINLISNISKDFNYIKFLVDETNHLLKLINNKIDILKKIIPIFRRIKSV